MFQKLLRIGHQVLWTTIAAALVLLALIVSLGRYYMPQISAYQADIMEQLHQRINLDFDIGRIEGEWRGLTPVVRLHDFRLLNSAGEAVIETSYLAVYIDLLDSLYHQTPLLQTVSLANARISLDKHENGQWSLQGFAPLTAGSGNNPAEFVLSQLDLLEMTGVQIEVHLNDGPVHLVNNASIVLRKSFELYNLTAELNGQNGRRQLRLVAEMDGWLDQPSSLRGYLELDAFDLGPASSLLGDLHNKLPAQFSGKLWLDWAITKGWDVQGELEVPVWGIAGLANRELATLNSLSFGFVGQAIPGQALEMSFRDFAFEWYGRPFLVGELDVSHSRGEPTIRAAVSEVDLGLVKATLEDSGLLNEALNETLATLNPAGKLRNLHLQIPLNAEQLALFSLRGELADASLSSWKGAPGALSVDGYVEAGTHHGYVDLDNSPITLSFGIYDEPLAFNAVSARVAWSVGERVSVNSGIIRVAGDFGRGNAQLDLDIPLAKQPGDYPVMSLVIGIAEAPAEYHKVLVPNVVSDNLRNWLSSSIKGGRVREGGFIYYGDLAGSDELGKTVQLALDIEDGDLQYHPQWPEISQTNAYVSLSDDKLRVTSPRGALMNSIVENVEVNMAASEGESWLGITGDLRGPAEDVMVVLRDSPLAAITGNAFDQWRATGDYTAELKMNIPLAGEALPQVEILGSLNQASLSNPTLALTFTELGGVLGYSTKTGLESRELTGRLWGEPLTAHVTTTEASGQSPGATILVADTYIEAAALARWLDSPILTLASGRSTAQGRMTLYPENSMGKISSLVIHSNIEGIALDLPAPFGKTAKEAGSLTVSLGLGDALGGSEIRYGDSLTGRFVLGESEEIRGGIWVGGEHTPVVPEEGTIITGVLESLVLDEWLDTLEKYRSLEGQESLKPTRQLQVRDLKVKTLEALGESLSNVSLDVGVRKGAWIVDIDHTGIKGSIGLPVGEQPMQLDLEYLRFPLQPEPLVSTGAVTAEAAVEDTGEEAAAASFMATMDPADIPMANARVGELTLNGRNIGSWFLNTRPFANGVRVQDLFIKVAGSRLASEEPSRGASLVWTLVDGRHETGLDGMLRAGNLDELFQSFGYETGIVSKRSEIIFDLAWAAPPDAVSAALLRGDIHLDISDGKLLQTSGAAVEALKIFGILNINNFARRLKLDFSDLFDKGFSYDKVHGIVTFEPGMLRMVEPLEVVGPSSNLKMSGDFNLITEEVDARLVVVLPITSNLPWVVALAGGLPVAAGVFVAGKVFEKQLQKLTSAVYKVSGTLDEPQIEFQHMVEKTKAGSTDSPNQKKRGPPA